MRLTEKEAVEILGRAGQAAHLAALEFEQQVGGLQIGDLILGVGGIAENARFPSCLRQPLVAQLAQIALGSDPYGDLVRFWICSAGWVYLEHPEGESFAPVAKNWREFVIEALRYGGNVGESAHRFVALMSNWPPAELAHALDLPLGGVPRGPDAVVWDPQAAQICWDLTTDYNGVRKAPIAITSAPTLDQFSHILINARTLEPQTTVTLLEEFPLHSSGDAGRLTSELCTGEILDTIPTFGARRIILYRRAGGEIDWQYLSD